MEASLSSVLAAEHPAQSVALPLEDSGTEVDGWTDRKLPT